MLADASKKVLAQASVINTQTSIGEVIDNDGDMQIKCATCDFNARSRGMLEVHMKAEHSTVIEFKCKVCSKICPNQDNLEVHMAEKHTGEIDCKKCMAVFRKEQDVYDHSNVCNEILQINQCTFCNKEVISKTALRKHLKSCQQKKVDVLCRNGELGSFFKANRCNFFHPMPQDQQPHQVKNQNREWKTVQRKAKKVLWICRFCTAQIHSHEAGRNHICEMHPSKNVEEQLREKRINFQPKVFPQKRQSTQQQTGRPKLWCRYQDSIVNSCTSRWVFTRQINNRTSVKYSSQISTQNIQK